ncbi:collagen-like protein [Solirubrobacter soli]|uniref:collagen-like protein n=1 Tax=Solirubrobacter soli TaxID=363832 RepID=UPI000411B59A|nr:collagen-like protein [Solirubrobacter soli]
MAVVLSFTPAAHAQATRTWVSGVGDDANPCSRTAPCKTFAGAISKTASGGEINATDSGGFGAVTITKPITIDTRSVLGGVLNSGINGVIVNTDGDVVLRGLDIYGSDDTTPPIAPCAYAGTSGVRVLKARSLRIEDSRIARQQNGIEIANTTPAKVFVNRVDISDNCAYGIKVAPAGATAQLLVQDSSISNSGTGLSVGDNGAAWLSGVTLFGNALGLQPLGTGTITDDGNTTSIGNTDNGAPTTKPTQNAAVPGPQGPAGPTGATGPQGPAGEPAIKLLVAASQPKLTFKAGKAVSLSYAATTAAKSTLTIAKGTKKIATVNTAAKAGANTIKWNGKAGKKAAAAGAYTLTLIAVGADGQTAKTSVALKLTR